MSVASLLQKAQNASASGSALTVLESLNPGTQAYISVQALANLTGIKPKVYDGGDKWIVRYSDADAIKVRAWLAQRAKASIKGLTKKSPETIPDGVKKTEYDLGNIINPVLMSYGLLFVAVLGGGGYLLGSWSEKRKRKGGAK